MKKKVITLTLMLCLVLTCAMPAFVMAETTTNTQTVSADGYVYQPGVNMNYSEKPVIDYLTSFWNKTTIRDYVDEKVFNTAVKYDDTNHPSGGVTVLVFFCTRCGVDRADFDKLNATGWLDDPRVNVVAYEAGGPSLPRVDLNFFVNNYISEDTASKIEFHPNGWYVFHSYLNMLYRSKAFVDQSFYNYPLVLVITEEEVVIETGLDNKEYIEGTTDMAYVVRYAEIGKAVSGVIDNTLKYHFGGVSDTQQEVSVPTDETWNVSVGGQQDYNAVEEVVTLTNQARKAKDENLSNLIQDDQLTKAAMQRAAELSLNFDHERPDGRGFYTALEGVYTGRIDNGTTENIACASLDAEEAVKGWIESQAHYENMIDPGHTRMGVGYFEADGITYWVQLFDDEPIATAQDAAKEDTSIDEEAFKEKIKSDYFTVKTKTKYLDVNALKTTTVHLAEKKTISTVSNNTTLADYENLQANGSVKMKATYYTDAKDASGNVIAKASMDDKGNLVLTGQSEGSGTMELKFSENQKTTIKINVTVSKKATVNHDQEEHTCKWSNWKTWYPGNCYDVVKERRYCLCGEKEYRNTNRYNHSALLDYKREEPTCTTTGRTAGTKCYDCKTVIAGLEEIPVLPHDMQVLREGEEATCSSWGLTPELKCSGCYYTEKAEAIPKLPHKELVTIEGKPATCKSYGLSDGKKCKVCGTVTVKQKAIPSTGKHTPYVALKGTAATCKKEGKTDLLKCSVCQTTVQPQMTIPKSMEHAYKESVTQATLYSDGKISQKCADCGVVKTQTTIRMPKTFTLSKTTYTYNGNVCTPAVTVKDANGKALREGTDYTVSYVGGRVNPGTYNVTVKLIGNYIGATTLSFEIKGSGTTGGVVTPTPNPGATVAKVKSVTVAKSIVYTGKALKPKVTVKDTKGKIVKATNYKVTYKNNKEVGKATVTVKFKGSYSGTKIVTFKIVPKKPTIQKAVAAKNAVNVKWAKGKKAQVTGYEVMTATDKKFIKGKKTTKVNKYAQTSVKVKSLKAKKTYYVKVRVYKTVKGVKYYSAWSSVKSVKTK